MHENEHSPVLENEHTECTKTSTPPPLPSISIILTEYTERETKNKKPQTGLKETKMSKFAEAAAEYQRNLTEHRKCPRTCAKCRYSECVDKDEECDTCPNFNNKKRLCRCTEVEAGKDCQYYSEVKA